MRADTIHISDDGRVSSVDAVNAAGEVERFTADWVISDIHPALTVGLIEECKQVKKVFRNRMSHLKNSYGVFTANVILKPDTLPYMNKNLFVHTHDVDLWGTDYSHTLLWTGALSASGTG